VVAKQPHGAARRQEEASLVKPDEADDITIQRVGLPVRRRQNDLRRGCPLHVRRQLPAIH
jgi:hypothetical protein